MILILSTLAMLRNIKYSFSSIYNSHIKLQIWQSHFLERRNEREENRGLFLANDSFSYNLLFTNGYVSSTNLF